MRWGLTLLLATMVVACSGAPTVDSTSPTEGSLDEGELVDASVSLGGQLDVESTELPLLVTYNGCSGGTVPSDIDSMDVEVEESQEAVVIRVVIRLPPQPFPTTCPENPILDYVVELDSPLGDRVVDVRSDRGTVRLWP